MSLFDIFLFIGENVNLIFSFFNLGIQFFDLLIIVLDVLHKVDF